MRKRLLAILGALLVIVLYSLSCVLTKLALAGMRPLTLGASINIVGWLGLSCYVFVIRRRKIPRHLDRGTWVRICAMGLGSFTVSRVFGTLALERMEATSSAFLGSFTGVFTLIIGLFVMKEYPSLWQLIGTIVSIWGVYIFYPALPTRSELVGVGMRVVGMVTTGSTNNIARDVATSERIDTLMFSWLSMSIGVLPLPFIALALEGVPVFTRTGIAVVLYAGLLSTAFGLTLWNFVLKDLQAFEASLIGNTSVVFTGLLGWGILGEELPARRLAAIAVVLIGTGLIQIRSRGLLPGVLGRARSGGRREVVGE